jgi:excinuclease UvrABC nuclease subunit
MSKKTVKYKPDSIDQLPNNKPVVYKIQTEGGNNNYTGVAKRGRVNERIKEHLGEIPGASVQIEQVSSIDEALKKESNIISRSKPKYNIKGK